MPEAEQATTGTKSIEEQYRELQAEFTRRSQQLAEYDRAKAAGELVDKASYDEHVKKWANDHPDEAQDWLGWNSSGNQQPGAIGGQAGFQMNDPLMGFDDSIFDPQSESHQKFVREHGEKGLRQAQLSRLAPELLEATGLGRQVSELLERDKQREEELSALREQAQQAQKYAVSAFDKSNLLEKPALKDVRETIAALKENDKLWFDVVQKYKAHDDLAAKVKDLEAKLTPQPPPPQPQSAQPPEQLADRIDQASVVPQGAAGSQGGGPSQYADMFDYAVDKALGKVA